VIMHNNLVQEPKEINVSVSKDGEVKVNNETVPPPPQVITTGDPVAQGESTGAVDVAATEAGTSAAASATASPYAVVLLAGAAVFSMASMV
jgi:hypothetical protein